MTLSIGRCFIIIVHWAVVKRYIDHLFAALSGQGPLLTWSSVYVLDQLTFKMADSVYGTIIKLN